MRHLAMSAVSCLALAMMASTQQKRPSPVVPNPKCQFLKQEIVKVTGEEQQFVQVSNLRNGMSVTELSGTEVALPDYVKFVAQDESFVANRAILAADLYSCESGELLSASSRIDALEHSRTRQLESAKKRWVGSGFEDDSFEPISEQINAIFDAEEKTFYRTSSKLTDPDVIKDYGDIIDAVANSPLLPSELKNVLTSNAELMRYDEAGRLHSTLSAQNNTGLGYAYALGKTLQERAVEASAQRVAQAAMAQQALESPERNIGMRTTVAALAALFAIIIYFPLSYTRAKFKAFRTHAREVPFWLGTAHLVLWQPGETVVILKNKQLIPMADPMGGFRVVSAMRGEEYLGFINCKTHFLRWDSDYIHTSDGLKVQLALGVWWKVGDSALFVRRISDDFQVPEERGADLSEAARLWVENLTGSTVREHVNRLPAEKLISPYVKAYIQVGNLDAVEQQLPEFSELVLEARTQLNGKAHDYGIDVERLEVQRLTLPDRYQEKLEAVRVAFLDPHESRAKTEAQRIALEGLAGVIGSDRVGLIEILKHVDLSGMPAVTGMLQVLQPVTAGLAEQTNKALSAPVPAKARVPELEEGKSPGKGV